MIKSPILIVLSIAFLVVNSCTTYLIPVNSFKNQFAGIDSTKLNHVKIVGPLGETYYYLASPIKKIKCEDKKGNSYELTNSPSIEIRFTHGENRRRTTFYFDRIFVNDSCVVGVKSRFISSIRKTIPLNSISKIEIQDGRKNFHYAND